MSIVQFNQLNQEEKELLFHAPALVSFLIAGSDEGINKTEEEKSKHLVRIRTNTGDPILFDFYKEVEVDFDEQFQSLVNKYSDLETEPRTQQLIDELTKLNEVLPRLDGLFARAYVKSLRTLAHTIAESSGGLLGFFSVSYNEGQLIGLEMISY